MAATQSGHEDIVAQLIESGAEVNARLRTTRWTALMLATLNNHLPVVKLLLKHGASKEVRGEGGEEGEEEGGEGEGEEGGRGRGGGRR